MERHRVELESKLISDKIYLSDVFRDKSDLCFKLVENENDDFLEIIIKEEKVDDIYVILFFDCLYNNLKKSMKCLLYNMNYSKIAKEADKILFIACKKNYDEIAKNILIRSNNPGILIESKEYEILYHIYKNNMIETKTYLKEKNLDYSKSPLLLKYYLEQKDEKNMIEIIISNNIKLEIVDIEKLLENKMLNVLIEINKHINEIGIQINYLKSYIKYEYIIGAETIIKSMIINNITMDFYQELNHIFIDSINKNMESVSIMLTKKICENDLGNIIKIEEDIIKNLYEHKMMEIIKELLEYEILLKKNLKYAVIHNEIKISHEIIEKMSMSTSTGEIDEEMSEIFLLALENKNEIVSKALIRQNMCDLTRKNSKNETAILIACRNRLEEIALEILEKPFAASKNIDGYDELMYASNNEMISIVTKLLALECCNGYYNYKGETALSIACKKKNNEIAREIMDSKKFDPRAIDEEFGNTALINACQAKLETIALRLIETGNSIPEHVNKQNETALTIAISLGLENLSNKLINVRGSSLSTTNFECGYALFNACKYKMLSTASLLLDTGYDRYDIKTKIGETFLMHACFNSMNDVCMRLIESKKCRHKAFTIDDTNSFKTKDITALKIACRNENISPKVIYGILDLYDEQPVENRNTNKNIKIWEDEIEYVLEWAKKNKVTDYIVKKYKIL
jgi:hypothetical protein